MTSVDVNAAAIPAAPAPADPGGLSPARELDSDQDGDVDATDVTALRAGTGPDARWRANQAAMLVATGAARDLDATVRGSVTSSFRPSGSAGPRDAVAAIEQLELDRVRGADVPLVAAFDYDDTLAHGDVFLPAIRVLASRALFDAAGLPAMRTALAKAGVDAGRIASLDPNAAALALVDLVGPNATVPPGVTAVPIADAFYAFGDAMRGMVADDARAAIRDAMVHGAPSVGVPPLRDELIDASPAAGDGMRDVVRATAAKGLTPWLVTWGFDFIAREAAPHAGIRSEHVVGHGMHERDGRFAGLELSSAKPKWQMLRDAIGAPPIVAFGNSSSDLPMLDAAAGPTFLVNPSSAAMRDALAARPGRTTPIWFTPHAA